MADYDLLVLGAGNAGLAGAGVANAAGWRVAVAENRDVGGTCPLRGCVPKKVLVAAAEVMDAISRAAEHGILVDGARLDWAKLIERKATFVKGVPEDFKQGLQKKGIDVLEGAAKFVGPTAVEVGGRRAEARKILIATGSTPRSLPFPGAGHMITSDEILDLRTQPGEIVFVGAGVISLEFSHVLARAGTRVTILELLDRPLPAMDPDAVAQVEKATRALGIDLVLGVKVSAIEKSNSGFTVHYESGAVKRTVFADVVANGAGRVPAIENLDLDAGGVIWDRKGGVRVNEFLRSVSNPDVFVAGDALAGPPQLSPVASYQGKLAGNNLIGREPLAPDYRTVPSCVYTVPALAQVGSTEDQARREGLDFKVKVSDMVSWRSARTYAESVAYAKVLIERTTDRILGAHLVGHGAPEVVHMFAFAMEHGVTSKDIRDTVFAYPTFTSDIKYLV